MKAIRKGRYGIFSGALIVVVDIIRIASDANIVAWEVEFFMSLDKVERVCRYSGLGLCWAAEEALSFSVAPTIGCEGLSLSILYAIYLVFNALLGLALVSSKYFEEMLASHWKIVVPVFGLLGLLLLSLPYNHIWLTCLGVCLFVIGSLALNYVWFKALSEVSSVCANKMIVATAVVTLVFSCAWSAIPSPLMMWLIAVLLVLSYASYAVFRQFGRIERGPLNSAMQRRLSKTIAPIVGVAIIAVGFAYLQYGAYSSNGPTAPFGESLSHGVSCILLFVVVLVLKDSEHTVAAKIASMVMLCAFVFAFAFKEDTGISITLAAGCEGMLELVVLLSLAELASYSEARPGVLLGSFLALFSGAQLLGCLLEALTHGGVDPAGISIGMLLVVLLIVTAVWLLNDRMVTRLLWSGEYVKNEEKDACHELRTEEANVGEGDALSFEEKAGVVASVYELTPRESEIMLQFAKGRSSSFIAEQLFVSNNTIRSHISHVYSKCGVHSRQELISLVENADARH